MKSIKRVQDKLVQKYIWFVWLTMGFSLVYSLLVSQGIDNFFGALIFLSLFVLMSKSSTMRNVFLVFGVSIFLVSLPFIIFELDKIAQMLGVLYFYILISYVILELLEVTKDAGNK